MHRVPTKSLLCLAVALLVGCGGPVLLLPGGELEGTKAETPPDWSFTNDIDTVELETRPADPYSVNIWLTASGEHLYVHAGTNRAAWVDNIEADPRVRLGIEGSVYALAAARVESQEEFDRFSDDYERKYGRRPGNENVAEAYLFRLTPR